MNEEELNSSSPSDSSLTNPSSLSSPTFDRSKLSSEQSWATSNFSQGLTPPPDFTEPRDNSQPFQRLGDFGGDFERQTIFSLGYQQPLTPSSISVTSDSSDLDSRSKKGSSLEPFVTEAILGPGGDVEMSGDFSGGIQARSSIQGSKKSPIKLESALDMNGESRGSDPFDVDQFFNFDEAALSVPDQVVQQSSSFSTQIPLHNIDSSQQHMPLSPVPFSSSHFGRNFMEDDPNNINMHMAGNRRKRSQDHIFDDGFLDMSDDGNALQTIKSTHTTAVSSPAYYDANSPDDSRSGQRFTTPPNSSTAWDQYSLNPPQARPIAGSSRINQKRPSSITSQSRSCAVPPQPQPQPPSHPATGVHFPMHLPSTLSVDQIPTKSRVETQIPVKIHLFPFPAGVTKLHLPRHTISKPKLYAKPPVTKSPDMLELHANLVCSSAMRNHDWLASALARARGEDVLPGYRKDPSQRMEMTEGSSGDDSDDAPRSENSNSDKTSPLSGGEVKICLGCMSRERKRAARKKAKKIKEEDEWKEDEAKRAVVFNNTEVREWMPISKSQYHSGLVPGNLEGGMMVELHMRLACYCRHQGEKEGFRVIFTIKNHLDEVIAQQITSSILITDDHKSNSTLSTLPAGSQEIKIIGAASQQGAYSSLHPNSNQFAPRHDGEQGMFSQTTSPVAQAPQYSNPVRFDSPFNRSGGPLSPQSSVSQQPPQPPQFGPSPGVPHTKKRRINSMNKVPANLAMTKLENPNPSFQGSQTVSSQHQFMAGTYDMNNFGQGSSLAIQFQQEPSTPSETNDSRRFSFDGTSGDFRAQIEQPQFTSPRSAYASAVTSPSPRSSFASQQAQHSVLLRGIPHDSMQRHDRDGSLIPEIGRLIPGEGTTRGGVEVTVLGKGFVNGLTVLFGDTPAAQNVCFSSSTLICLLPPRSTAGPVVVTLQGLPLQKAPSHYPLFTYVDDTEKSLMELALQIVGIKMHGSLANAQDIARSIIENRTGTFGQGTSQAPDNGSGNGSRQHSVRRLAAEFGQFEFEPTLLRCLDAIDIDDSPHPARLNLRNKAGQTMLHLACILGMQRFVAALLARGALSDVRDKNGYTPMHFAALHNKPEIVKRLLLNKADASILTKTGKTAQDLALMVAQQTFDQAPSKRHSRASSETSDHHFGRRSRANSAASMRSLWASVDPPCHGRPKPMGIDDFYATSDEAVSVDTDGEEDWENSRGSSLRDMAAATAAMASASVSEAAQVLPGSTSESSTEIAPSPSAMMAAWKEGFAASLQNLQNHWNFSAMPTAAGLQQNLLQNLNPWSAANPNPPQHDMKDGDYKWWELFSNPQAPPAYDELFPWPGQPSNSANDIVLMRGADADDAKVAEPTVIERAESPASSSTTSLDMGELQRRIAKGGRDITKAQQDEYRAHARKMKKISNDRRLYFFWLPVLIFIMMAMATSWGPRIWSTSKTVFSFARDAIQDPSSVSDRLGAIIVNAVGGELEAV